MENWQRQRLFEAVGRAVVTIGQPLILLIDDLHWSDEQTITCLQYLMNLDLDFPLAIIGAIRPDEIAFVPPFANLVMTARSKAQLTEIALSPLDEQESATLAALVMGSELESSESRRIFQEAEGNPLFIVEMIRAASPISQLPATIQAVIESRLQHRSAREGIAVAPDCGAMQSNGLRSNHRRHPQPKKVLRSTRCLTHPPNVVTSKKRCPAR